MADNELLARSHVLILGLGLMGGSLALALKDHCASLSAVDPHPDVALKAMDRKIVDGISNSLEGALQAPDIIILATPVRTILQLLEQIPDYYPQKSVIFDLGSTKSEILRAMEQIPARFDPIGGHPMCGKEKSSLDYAEATLFQNCVFALCPLDRTSEKAKMLASQIVSCVGGKALWLDADAHDSWAAATSHLPYILSNVLAQSLPPEAVPLIGPGFRSSSRLAGSDITMMRDILLTNRRHILEQIQVFETIFDQIKDALVDENNEKISEILTEGYRKYNEWISR